MKLKTILTLNLAAWMASGFGHSTLAQSTNAPAASTNLLSLESVLQEVLARNPAIKAARAKGEAMDARVPQARAWDDPRVGVDVERSGTTHFTTYTDNEWMVSQTIPLSGKNRLRAKAASSEASGAWVEVRRRELDLTARARASFFQYANAHTQLELNLKNDELLKQFAEISRDKYRAGTRMQAEVLMAETELAKNGEVRRDLERRISDEQSRLNVLMNRPPQSPLAAPVLLPVKYPDVNFDRLVPMALTHRPELQSAQLRIKASQARQTLAHREWIPDPEIRVEARQYNGAAKAFSEYDTGIFFNFPWVNRGKYKAGIREADKNRESAEAELAALQNETIGMVREQVKKIETAHHHSLLFAERILPLARQTVDAMRIAYLSDKASLLDLLSAQRTLRESESMQQQHHTDYQMAVAEMEGLIGVDPAAPNANLKPNK